MMGEIDTKSIESVQSSLSFFDQGIDHRKHSPNKDEQEIEKGRELETIEKELANIKVQLEAKESAYNQALLKIDHHHKTADHLSTLLKTSDLQKDFYINESRESRLRVNELELALNQMGHQLSESGKVQDQLIQVTNDLESAQGQLMQMESELSVLKEAKIEPLSRIQALEMSLNEEKLQKEEILKQVSELNQLKEDMEMLEKKNSDRASYVSLLEADSDKLRIELEKTKEAENEAEVEVALLKFELHKGRSRLASLEADESRAQSEKTALYNALQQMGIESEELKQENRLLKEAMKSADTEHDQEAILIDQNGNNIENTEEEEEKQVCDHEKEMESMKREVEVATAKIGELRTRAEQAISRAEAAEKMKSELEDKMKKRKEQKERRKAALAALREESISRDVGSIKYGTSVKNYQPLGKVLNMKF